MPPPVAIRLFQLHDMERILEIERRSFGRDAYDRKLFAEFFHTCGGLFLVAVGGKRVLGYMVTCTGFQQPPARAELVSVAVDPVERARGIGSALMNSTLRRLRRRGVGRFTLTVRDSNRRARKFYERYGFAKLRKLPGYYEDGENGVLMRKMLRFHAT